ncbi:hypothetical protein HDV62DRAFT_382720 [Trichoderma sp. SZMC 28011]
MATSSCTPDRPSGNRHELRLCIQNDEGIEEKIKLDSIVDAENAAKERRRKQNRIAQRKHRRRKAEQRLSEMSKSPDLRTSPHAGPCCSCVTRRLEITPPEDYNRSFISITSPNSSYGALTPSAISDYERSQTLSAEIPNPWTPFWQTTSPLFDTDANVLPSGDTLDNHSHSPIPSSASLDVQPFQDSQSSPSALSYDASISLISRPKSNCLSPESHLGGQFPLHLAARGGFMGIIGLLVSRGARLDAKDTYGRTALHYAAEAGHLEAVGLIDVAMLVFGYHLPITKALIDDGDSLTLQIFSPISLKLIYITASSVSLYTNCNKFNMVFFVPKDNLDVLTCYLLADLSSDELQAFKSAFELGNNARFDPRLHIKIVRPPEDYIGKSHEYIRRKEDEAGREEKFLILDDEAVKKNAVWYISWFADEEHIEWKQAESTDVLWKMLIRTDKLSLVWVNYSIGNMSLQEDLGNCGVKFPVKAGFEQPKVYDLDMDMQKDQYRQPVWVRAEPSEYEINKGGEVMGDYIAPPNTYARLKNGVAEAVGVINDWTMFQPTGPFRMSDGTKKEFPEGTMVLQLKWNPDFPWPPYKWPEGSL